MANETPGFRQIWLGTVDTPESQGFYPVIGNVNTLATGTFSPKITFGDYTKDAEDYISSLILSDLSGGMNVEDMNEGSDATRCWLSFLDTRRPGKITLNPEVERFTWSGASGKAYPLGTIGQVFYAIIGAEIAGFNDATDTFYTDEAITLTPVNKAVTFAGRIFVPCGGSGYMIVSESDVGNPTVTNVTSVLGFPASYDPNSPITDAPAPLAFTVFDQRLWAISTSGALAWSYTGSDDEWTWPHNDARQWYPRLLSGATPQRMIPFYGPDQSPRIAIATDQGVFLYNWDTVAIDDTPVKFPPHPDHGAAMEVWRPGEDLHVSLGLDTWKLTAANVVVPMSGLARDDGMPPQLWGRVVDMEPEISELFQLVGPVTGGVSGFIFDAKVGEAGDGDGEFAGVRGLATDSNGDVWAADPGNARIQRFSSALAFEVESGSAGDGDGEFAADTGAWDVAHDGDGGLWVVDRDNHRVQKFDESGEFQAQIDGRESGWTVLTYGSPGSGTSPNFGPTPQQVATDSNGNVYIADWGNNRLVKLDSSGAFVESLPPPPAAGIPFVGVAVDASGNIYTTYTTTGGVPVVIKYNQASATMAAGGGAAAHIATDGTYLYVVATPTSVQTRLCDDLSLVAAWGSNGSGAGQFQNPYGIATDGTHVYVSDPTLRRITKFTKFGTYVTHWGGAGSGDGQFSNGPWGLAVDADGDIWVTSGHGDNRIQRFSNTGMYKETLTQERPAGIAFAPDGSFWTNNQNAQTVVHWIDDSGGGNADGQFLYPEGVAVNHNTGRIYVADTGNNRIQYFTSDGTYEGQWGGQGVANGLFNAPVALDVDQNTGSVYVVDQTNARVQQFSATGTFQRVIGTSGTGDGQFQRPTAIAVRPDGGGIFVADETRDNVQAFSSSGNFLTKIGGPGTADGRFTAPCGLAFDDDGDVLYVSDRSADRIQKFDFEAANSSLTYPYLAAHTGVGIYGKWRGTDVGVNPTYAKVIATANRYDLWWGMDDGYLYRMKLRRYFHNPRQGLLAGEDRFQPSEELITSRFDAAMLGFWKIASHMVAFVEEASATEYISIDYRTDADAVWVPLGQVTTEGKTYLPFGVDPNTTFSTGVPFNWIQFRVRAYRGDDATKAPIIKSLVLCFLKVPQNASAFNFHVAFPKGDTEYLGRSAADIRRDLFNLVTSRQMVRLRLHEWEGDTREFRGYLTSVSGEDVASDLCDGSRAINFIEVSTTEITSG